MPTSTWERLPDERRAAVVQAAVEEFTAKGYASGSLNVIARNAGVAKGSLFQYFVDKADLYTHLADLACENIRAAMVHELVTIDWGAGYWRGMREMLYRWEAYFHEHPDELAVTTTIMLQSQQVERTAMYNIVSGYYVGVIGPVLQAGVEMGAIDPAADLDAATAILIVLLSHVALAPHAPGLDRVLGLSSDDQATRRAAIDRMFGMFVRSLRTS